MASVHTGTEPFKLHHYVSLPLVTWHDVVATEAPGQEPTRARLRTLRERNRATTGIQVPHRGAGGVEGTSTFHSTLSVWSTRLRQIGLDDKARLVHEAGTAIEKTFGRYLRAYLTHHPLEQLDQADFWPRLVKDTSDALVDIVFSSDDVKVVFGQVKAGKGAWWSVVAEDEPGAPTESALLRSLLEQRNVREGEHVFVIERMLGQLAITEVDRAVPVPSEDDVAGGPPFDDEEYEVLAAIYRHGGGRLPDDRERAELVTAYAEKSIPRRKLRARS